jgi:hypothetical protein
MPRTMTKAAIDYLKASGATAISVVAIDGVCTFHVGHIERPNPFSARVLMLSKSVCNK